MSGKNISRICFDPPSNHKLLDIKLGHFIEDERDGVLKPIKNRKSADLYEVTSEVWKTRKFDDILIRQHFA